VPYTGSRIYKAELARGRFRCLTLKVVAGMLRTGENGNPPNLWHPLFQQLQTLADEIDRQIRTEDALRQPQRFPQAVDNRSSQTFSSSCHSRHAVGEINGRG